MEENLGLSERMKAGEFKDGHCVLRAVGDMASNNMKMRDPTFIESAMRITIEPAMTGVSTPCTTTPIHLRMPSKT